MDRVSATGYQTLTVGRSWQNKNLGAGINGTTFDQLWFQGVQESIVETISASGQTPTDSTLGLADAQLLDAVLAFGGANVQTISATPGSPLTAISAGLVAVSAAAGNVSITMPAVAALGGHVQRWKFIRTDNTGNTVSISFHAGDAVLIGGATGPLSLGPQSQLDLTGDGTTHWQVPSASTFVGVFADTGTANAMVVTLPGPASLAAIVGMPFIVKKGASPSSSALTVDVNTFGATQAVLADGTVFSAAVIWPASAEVLCVYDGTNIVCLSYPAPSKLAPLASPALTGTPTVPTAAAGTNTTQAASTAFVQAALPQTWANVTGSRAIGTTYTNSSGKPMAVSVWGIAGGTSNLSASVGGSQIAASGIAQNSGNTIGIYFQVPAGATYEVVWVLNSGSLSDWLELT